MQPIFIVGSHRSGTTLLRFIIDAHPRIACPPESKFIAAIDAFLKYPQALAGLSTLGVRRSVVIGHFGLMARAYLDHYCASRGKPRWAEKTPHYYRILPLIDELFGCEAAYVVITRHPLDGIVSLMSTFTASSVADDPELSRWAKADGEVVEGWAGYWAEAYEMIANFRDSHFDRCVTISYEALAVDPQETVSGVLSFLDEDMPENLLDMAFSQPHDYGFEDPRIRSTHSVHAASIGRRKSLSDVGSAAAWRIVRSVAERWGYSPVVDLPSITR
jgi:hypothetical protein